MTTSVWRPIRADLRRILLSVTGIPQVVFELQSGVPYKPTVEVAHLTEKLEKGETITETLGTWGMVSEDGIYGPDLWWPRNLSRADGEDLSDAIRLAYWHGREIRSAGPDFIAGTVQTASARQPIPRDGWVVFPVRVGFYFRRRTSQGRAA